MPQPAVITQPGRILVTGTSSGNPTSIVLRVESPDGTIDDVTGALETYNSTLDLTTISLELDLPDAGQWDIQWIVDGVGSRVVTFKVLPGLPDPTP